MDPALIEVLRFGTAILAGGLVAVIAHRLAADHDARVRRAEREARTVDLRRALVAEIDENIRRLGPGDRVPFATVRTAWEAGRVIDWPRDVLVAASEPYAAAAQLEPMAALNAAVVSGMVEAEGSSPYAQRADMITELTRRLAARFA